MNPIERNLMPGETLLIDGELHWIIFFWPLLLSLALVYFMFKQHILFIINYAAIALIIYFLTDVFIRYINTHFLLTSARVIKKTGWFATQTFDISLSKIESVHLDQSLLGKIMGYGNVVVNGIGGDQMLFGTIENPYFFQQQIFQAMEKNKVSS